MSALRKTTTLISTPTTDLHGGQGAELFTAGAAPRFEDTHMHDGACAGLFTAGAAPSVDGTHTHMFSSGSAPSKETAQLSGVLTELFSSGS